MYKQGQGMLSRVGVFLLLLLVGGYTGYCWNAWYVISELYILRMAGTGIAVFGSLALGYWISFLGARSVDYLIDMDGELRKVIWPATKPPFDPKAEAWGATYVVIVTVLVMAAFIFAADYILDLALGGGAATVFGIELRWPGLLPLLYGTGA